MTRQMTLSVAFTVLLALASSANATGRLTGETIAQDAWLSKADLTQRLSQKGWEIRFVKEDGGCWEVYGQTPEGQRVEAYFHPSSGKKLLVLRRGEVLFRAIPE